MHNTLKLASIVLLASVLSSTHARAQTSPRIVLEPWDSSPHWAATTDRLWYIPGGHLQGADTEIAQFWWDSFGRIKLDRRDPAPPLAIGYRILTSSFYAPKSGLTTGLTTIDFGGAFNLGPAASEWSTQVFAGAGTANDNHFDNHHAYYGIGAVNLHRRLDAGQSLDFGVDYHGGRSLWPGIPIPYGSYTLARSDLSLTVGLPASAVRWNPWNRLTVEASYAFPVSASAQVSLELFRGVFVFGDYFHAADGFFRKGQEDTRLFYQSDRAGLGVRWVAGKLVDLRIGAGYAFNQSYDSGFDLRRLDRVLGPSDHFYYFLNLVGTF